MFGMFLACFEPVLSLFRVFDLILDCLLNCLFGVWTLENAKAARAATFSHPGHNFFAVLGGEDFAAGARQDCPGQAGRGRKIQNWKFVRSRAQI